MARDRTFVIFPELARLKKAKYHIENGKIINLGTARMQPVHVLFVTGCMGSTRMKMAAVWRTLELTKIIFYLTETCKVAHFYV
jgi:hypothetical protein